MDGMQALIQNLDRLAREAPRASVQAVRDVALDVQGRAQTMAPVDTGQLRASATTEVGVVGDIAEAVVSFNGTTPDGRHSYALIQHERLDFRHPRGGEAKYLEKAINEVASDFEQNALLATWRILERLQ